VAVVGAGISGLAVARGLRARGVSCTLFEASARAGGVLRSSRQNGHLLEWGPQRLRLTPGLRRLVDELDLAGELLHAPPDAPLYIVRDGRLHPVPRSLPALLRASLLSPAARLRVLLEPFTAPVAEHETVAGAFRRKFGDEAYRIVLGPLFGGLYASDPANMRCADSLSRLVEQSGAPRSLMLYALRISSDRRTPVACTFRDGVATLPGALARSLGADLRLEHPVREIERAGPGWTLTADDGSVGAPGRAGRELRGPFTHVVLAVPAGPAARILARAAPEAAGRLARLTYNRLAMVHLAASGPAIPGFGYQTAFGEPLETRGVTFNDALFGRDGIVTAFLGGARNLQLPDWPDERIAALAEIEFRRVTRRPATALEVSRPVVPAYDLSWRALDDLRIPAGVHLCAGYLERAGVAGRLVQAERLVRKLAQGRPAPVRS
jgi:oxygen-dependent protoporphyrinogen oxidase